MLWARCANTIPGAQGCEWHRVADSSTDTAECGASVAFAGKKLVLAEKPNIVFVQGSVSFCPKCLEGES